MLVAPYNPAMRLGMGFNTFTQELRINDAVLLKKDSSSGTISGTDLPERPRPQYDTDFTRGPDGKEHVTLQVTWTAKFVDKVSDVTDSLNISGSLEIKCDAMGGSASGSGSFIDSKKMKESDINYFVQVKVINHVYQQENLTEFNASKEVKPGQFNQVYGDAFISGFIEGGEFNALVSVKVKDSANIQKIKGALEVSMNLKAVEIDAKAQGEMNKEALEQGSETTINVSWSGGGDIKGKNVTEWNLAGLKAVAMEFPEHVLACPMKISAILTKYNNLRSFVNQETYSTTSYDLAGSYASSLLDSYLDYKIIWRSLQDWMHELENGRMKFRRKDISADLATYKSKYDTHYNNITKAKEKSAKPSTEASTVAQTTSSGSPQTPAEPSTEASAVAQTTSSGSPLKQLVIPHIQLTPYGPDLFSLDTARDHCRFEMIKIVQEVDKVADNPTVATSFDRGYHFLNPMIFRMLLPEIVHSSSGEIDLNEAVQALSTFWIKSGAQSHNEPSTKFQLGRKKTSDNDGQILVHGFSKTVDEHLSFVDIETTHELDLRAHSYWSWERNVEETKRRGGTLVCYLKAVLGDLTEQELTTKTDKLMGGSYLLLNRNSPARLVKSSQEASKVFFVQRQQVSDEFSIRLLDDPLCAVVRSGSTLLAQVVANPADTVFDKFFWHERITKTKDPES